jgi:hypothetical protein
MGRMKYEHSYEKELKATKKKMLRMTARLKKHKRKITLMELGKRTIRRSWRKKKI